MFCTICVYNIFLGTRQTSVHHVIAFIICLYCAVFCYLIIFFLLIIITSLYNFYNQKKKIIIKNKISHDHFNIIIYTIEHYKKNAHYIKLTRQRVHQFCYYFIYVHAFYSLTSNSRFAANRWII